MKVPGARSGAASPGSAGPGIDLAVHVRPGGRRDAVEGAYDGVLAVRVTAPASEGRANVAVCRVLADAFGVPRHDVKVVSGQTAKRKRVHIAGDPDRLAALLMTLLT